MGATIPAHGADESAHTHATLEFRKAFLAADLPRLRELLRPDAYLLAAGAGAAAGRHDGPEGSIAFAQRLNALTGGTFRPLRDDAWDVAVGRHHAFLYQAFSWDVAAGARVSHEVWLLAFRDGKVARIFQYVEDWAPYAELG